MVLQFGNNRIFPEQHLCSFVHSQSMSVRATLPSANHIIDGLYIGNVQLALQVLRSDNHMGVTHMLSLVSSSILSSLCTSCACPPTSIFFSNRKPSFASFETAKHGSHLLRMVVPLMDTPEEDILQILQPCFDFINEGRRQGTVLVHCMAGRSRSAAVVTAYLMRTLSLPSKQAMEILNRNYKNASPNVGYMQQLEFLDRQPCKEATQVEDQQQGLAITC
eukprot:c14716_g1_i1 orf=115-774(-)